jgi:hypothetical protein
VLLQPARRDGSRLRGRKNWSCTRVERRKTSVDGLNVFAPATSDLLVLKLFSGVKSSVCPRQCRRRSTRCETPILAPWWERHRSAELTSKSRHWPIPRQTTSVTIFTKPKTGRCVTFLLPATYRRFADLEPSGTALAKSTSQKEKKKREKNRVEIATFFLAVLLLTFT